LSLGKVYESLCQPEQAKKYYEEVAALEKDSALGKLAQQAAKRMGDQREVALLEWFAEQKPRRPAPGFGTSGLPGLPNDLPERPDFSLPGLGQPDSATGTGTSGTGAAGAGTGIGSGLNLDTFGTDKPAGPALEFPKPGETKPGDPNAEPPAEPEKKPE
jgi:hypothetical protein